LVLGLGRIIFKSEYTARLAVLLLACYPNNIAYVQNLMSEIFGPVNFPVMAEVRWTSSDR
jgi:hypothetical protein